MTDTISTITGRHPDLTDPALTNDRYGIIASVAYPDLVWVIDRQTWDMLALLPLEEANTYIAERLRWEAVPE